MVGLLEPYAVAAAIWALAQHRHVRRRLATVRVHAVSVAPPPHGLPDRARRAVTAALRLRRATCLQRSLILQAWDAAHGRPRPVIIGVMAPSQGFRAHAWIDGDRGSGAGAGFNELMRLEP